MDVFVKDKLSVNGLSKRYGKYQALKSLTFSVRDGEFLSILGPSGCGKTTLLRILIGLLPPDSGTVRKDGADITRCPPDKRGMGIVFQNYALFERMTVLKNVEYALTIHKRTRASARETALRMLETVGLEDCAGKLPGSLSGGQRQRVAIARTLAMNPDVILFDEPMSALDASTRLSMRRELKSLQASLGVTMIYVTHDQEEAFTLSDRIMIMGQGEIRRLDTPESICAAPADDYVRAFVLDNLRSKAQALSRFVSEKGGAS